MGSTAGAAGKVAVNPATWIFNMKNRFNWRDKPDPERVGDDDVTPEEYARRTHRALMEMEDLDHGGDGTRSLD